jgi:hypothetical protein
MREMGFVKIQAGTGGPGCVYAAALIIEVRMHQLRIVMLRTAKGCGGRVTPDPFFPSTGLKW